MTIVCSECGNQNEDDSDFCASCGEPLEWTGVRVDASGAPVEEAPVEDPTVYDVGPLYESEPEAAPAPEPAPEPVAEAAPPPAVEEPPAASEPVAEPEPEPVAAEPEPEPVPEPVAAAAEPDVAPEPVAAPGSEPEPDNAAEQLLKKLPGRRRKEAAQPAAAAAPPAVPPPPPTPVRGATPPPPPSAPPSGPPSRIVPPPPTPSAPAAPADANGGTSAAAAPTPEAPPAPADDKTVEAAPVRLTKAQEEKARKKAEEEEAARLAAEEEARRKEAAKKLYIPVKTEPEPKPAPAPAPVVAVAEPVKLTWWQRFVAWLKRVWAGFIGLFRRKPKPAAPAGAPTAQTPSAAPGAAPAAAAGAAVAAAAVTESTVTAAAAPQQPAAAAPTAQQPSAAPPTARPPGKERQTGPKVPSAQKPTKEFERKGPKEVKQQEPEYEPGDLICTQCGTGNRPTNRFCKRCGSSLAEAPIAQKAPWYKRMLTALHLRKKKQHEAGYRKKQKSAGGHSFFWRLQSLSFRSVGLVFLAIAAIGLYAGWGPTLKHRGQSYYNYFHDLFLPSFKTVTPVSATASSHLNNATRPRNVFDGFINKGWISKPTRTHGVLQTVTIHFDSPVKFGVVGFKSGAQTKQGDLIQKYARPAKVRIFFLNTKGKLIKGSSKSCSLDDKPGFQKCGAVDLKGVMGVKVRVLSVYGKVGKKQSVAIAEIETKRRA